MRPTTRAGIERADARDRMNAELQRLEDAHAGSVRNASFIPGPEWTRGERERADNLRRGIAKLHAADEAEMAPLRAARLAAILNAPEGARDAAPLPERTPMYDNDPSGARRAGIAPQEPAYERTARLDAFRAIERMAPQISAGSADRLDQLVRRPEALGEAAYIAAVADPHYLRAFGKAVMDPVTGTQRMTQSERDAWDRVIEVRGTAMAIGAGGTGGYAVPFLLDPTLVDTGANELCPLRSLATVEIITANEKHYVNSTAVVAQYQAEAAATVEAGPTLTQPTLTAARGTCFVSASYEMFQDVDGLVTDLARLMQAGRNRLDAQKFWNGSGTNEPLGIAVPGTAGSLTDSQRVQTASADAVAVVDVYNTYTALDAGSLANLSWVASPTTWSFLYRSTPHGSETEPILMSEFMGPMLGGRTYNWTTMPDAAASGEQTDAIWLVGGDFRKAVVIGDRIGTSIELVPNLFHTDGVLPVGRRGLYMFWRSGAVVRDPNALRFNEVK